MMPPARQSPGQQHQVQDAIARLYVLWMVSTLLFVLALVVLVFIMSAHLGAGRDRVEEQNQRLAKLERTVLRLDSRSPEFPAERLTPAMPIARSEPTTRRTPPDDGHRPTTRPAVATSRPTTRPSAIGHSVAPLDDAALTQRLDGLLPLSEAPLGELADVAAADSTLNEALATADRADWRGRTWTHLALIAHLRGRDADAQQFLTHAADVGDTGAVFYNVAGGRMLAHGRATEVVALAERWRAADPANPQAALLLAEAHAALDDFPNTEAAVGGIVDASSLSVADQLRLGRVLIALEDWTAFARLHDALGPVEEALTDERDLQRAVRLMQDSKLTAALSILDYLAETRPDDLDVQVWRGAVLLRASQVEPAADVLSAAAERAPRRREPWYWLAMLDVRLENWDQARQHLSTAIEIAPRYVAAWEAFGIVELNAGEPTAAAERLGRAVDIHPRRASAQFLLALAEAKRSRRDAAEAALRTALELKPDLLDAALATEALTRLIDPAEIRKLAGTPDAPRGPGEPPTSTPASVTSTQPTRRDE